MAGLEGHAKLGWLMGAHPEMAIFRRFAALNAQNILYLQADLMTEEQMLRDAAQEDKASGHPQRSKYCVNWRLLAESISTRAREGEDTKQWKTFLRIRKKLKEFNKAVIQQAKLANLGTPSSKDVDELVDIMRSGDRLGIYLVGADHSVWSKPDQEDFLVIKSRKDEDLFASRIGENTLAWFYRKFGKCIKTTPDEVIGNTVFIKDEHVSQVTRFLATILSSLLPVLSIVALYLLDSMPKRLGAIAGFTMAFSVALDILTNARPVEIFASTAAFAAVQVVYVGTASV